MSSSPPRGRTSSIAADDHRRSSSPVSSDGSINSDMNVNSRASSVQSQAGKPSRTASQEWSEDGLDDRDHSHLHTVIDANPGSNGANSNGNGAYSYDHSTSSSSQQLLHPAGSASDGDALPDARTSSHHAHHESSPLASVFVLSATTLGAGILALPYAFSILGWLFGTVLLISIGFISSYAISLLISTARDVGATTYEELGHAIYPKYGKQIVVTTTLVLIFGSLTAFFVIIADTITPAVQNIVSNSSSFFVRREILLLFVALVFVFPLCLLKSIDALERWSFLAVGIILGFSVVILVDAIRKLHAGTAAPNDDGVDPDFSKNIRPIGFSVDTFEALPIICLAFTCQTMVFPIWNNLKGGGVGANMPAHAAAVVVGGGAVGLASDEDVIVSRASMLAPVSSMQWVANRALALCATLYLLVGLFGFFDFGLHTQSDVLVNFPTENEWFYDVVRILFVVAIGIHYPVVHFGFRTAILTTWYSEYTPEENRKRFWFITTACVVCSLLLALALPNLKDVFGLTGSICAFPYCFMFPTAFYLKLHHQPAGSVEKPAAVRLDGDENGKHQHASYSPLPNGNGNEQDATQNNSGVMVSPVVVVVRSPSGANSALDGPSLSPESPLLSSPLASSSLSTPAPLTRRQSLPAWTLLVLASILWVISIVVSFRDMVNDFRAHGI